MLRFILWRILWSIPVLLVVSLITFTLMHLIPGGPWAYDHSDRPISKSVQDAFVEKYGLDKPLHIQYLTYITNALRGELGPSYDGTRSVKQIIIDDFPVSAAFGLTALLIGSLGGVSFGLYSALKHNSRTDRWGTYFVSIGLSIPNFVLAIGFILVFSVNLHVLPAQFYRDRWQSWLLPLGLLTLRIFALMVRYTRAATLEVLHEDYIRTAHMKGLPDSLIEFRHILRNVLLPIVSLLGPLAADLVTGSFIIESIFGIPGLGKAFVTSIISRDYSLLMGVTLLFALILIVFNLLVDLSYSLIDPRITYR